MLNILISDVVGSILVRNVNTGKAVPHDEVYVDSSRFHPNFSAIKTPSL